MSVGMPRTVRLLLLCAVLGAAVGGLAAPRAHAAPPPPPSCAALATGNVVTSAHVELYYTDDKEAASAAYINETQAGVLLATLERAYKNFQDAGFPTPAVDPLTNKLVFQVIDLTPWSWWSVSCPTAGGG